MSGVPDPRIAHGDRRDRPRQSRTPAIPEAGGALAAARRRALALAGPLTRPVGSLIAVRTRQPDVVLTFDDGPEPGGTDRVLSALSEHGASATFFVLVDRARRHRSLVRDVLADGHEIGLHGMDHRRLSRLPSAAVRTLLASATAQLEDLLGAPVRWFRPPYGAQTPAVWRAARRQRLTSVLWGPCAWDWLDRPPELLAAQALRGLSRGSVLLAHDGHAGPEDGADDGPRPAFDRGDLVRRVLAGLDERGLRGRSLGDALVTGEAQTAPWFLR
ncbi:polysaccharide deacetylase family protein [Amycolatopsis sp. FDAARGOS 1241]|uniref:polysaccharide deacetylase family protein n=1 Tax=Amycolatopsis sp. FDAARGOS 1241 TaxID=2778070 RepID=UPI00194F2895|nr:polysaccharide deacetylase family protein [Amycolatopsis sp. FDAARGOS 1241]QRP47874.1 polysaccharide deacetylase family protein [Amycolatopsis sp. FDAARGOS 1241]